MKKRKILKVIAIILISILVVFGIALIVLICSEHKSTDNSGLESSSSVEVSLLKSNGTSYYFFDNKDNNSTAFIFYQGGGIDEKAYSCFLNNLSGFGVDCFLIDMPLSYSLFNIDAADDIISSYNYDNYYIGGHSLGGVCASMYAKDNVDKIDGIVLLASYCNVDLSNTTIKAISIYGSLDGVLNMDTYNRKKQFMPVDNKEHIIDGANHSGFGNYGEQCGDNVATLTKNSQQQMTAHLIYDFICNEG